MTLWMRAAVRSRVRPGSADEIHSKVVCGSVAVNRSGARIGKRAGYSDPVLAARRRTP